MPKPLSSLRDPIEHMKRINRRMFGDRYGEYFSRSGLYTDKPIFMAYNVARPLKDDDADGPSIKTDTVGCSHLCAHCWVANAALGGALDAPFMKKKLEGLPGKRFLQTAEEIFDRSMKSAKSSRSRAYHGISKTGGETTIWRGGARRLGELAQEHNMFVDLDTMGLQIAHSRNYLKAFDGLQDTLRFYVSIKHVEPEEFERFTRVKRKHMNDAFIAMERMLRAGFPVVPGGIVLNIWYGEKDRAFEKANGLAPKTLLYRRVEMLHEKLAAVHPLLPRLLDWHKITYGYVHQPKEQEIMMRQRGYTKQFPGDVLKVIREVFAANGSPIIEATVEQPRIIHPEWGGAMREILTDMSGKTPHTVYPSSINS